MFVVFVLVLRLLALSSCAPFFARHQCFCSLLSLVCNVKGQVPSSTCFCRTIYWHSNATVGSLSTGFCCSFVSSYDRLFLYFDAALIFTVRIVYQQETSSMSNALRLLLKPVAVLMRIQGVLSPGSSSSMYVIGVKYSDVLSSLLFLWAPAVFHCYNCCCYDSRECTTVMSADD